MYTKLWWFQWDRNHHGGWSVYIRDAQQVHVVGLNHLFRWSVLQLVTLVSSFLLMLDTSVHHGLICKITGMQLVKWRCWYMIPPIRQLLKTASNGCIEDAQQGHVIGPNQIFGVIIFLLVFELHTMRLFASLLLRGEVVSEWWMSVCWGKLPKLNVKEAKIRRFGDA